MLADPNAYLVKFEDGNYVGCRFLLAKLTLARSLRSALVSPVNITTFFPN